jgi:hypothetical protein
MLQCSSGSTENDLIEASKIFGKKSTTRSLTDYEKAVNDASFQLAKDNSVLLSRRDELFKLAREKVRESGFKFKKGASRSKLAVPTTATADSQETPHKRLKSTANERKHRLHQIQEELTELDKALKMKELRRNKAENVKNFMLCNTLSTEIRALLKEKRILENEKKVILRKERQADWYSNNKTTKTKQVEKGKISGQSKKSGEGSLTLAAAWSKMKQKSGETPETAENSDKQDDILEISSHPEDGAGDSDDHHF